ncbi:MAG: hypothetical protein U1E35_07915 [Rhodospirillales bacterium]
MADERIVLPAQASHFGGGNIDAADDFDPQPVRPIRQPCRPIGSLPCPMFEIGMSG